MPTISAEQHNRTRRLQKQKQRAQKAGHKKNNVPQEKGSILELARRDRAARLRRVASKEQEHQSHIERRKQNGDALLAQVIAKGTICIKNEGNLDKWHRDVADVKFAAKRHTERFTWEEIFREGVNMFLIAIVKRK